MLVLFIWLYTVGLRYKATLCFMFLDGTEGTGDLKLFSFFLDDHEPKPSQ